LDDISVTLKADPQSSTVSLAEVYRARYQKTQEDAKRPMEFPPHSITIGSDTYKELLKPAEGKLK